MFNNISILLKNESDFLKKAQEGSISQNLLVKVELKCKLALQRNAWVNKL